ncbi:MAG TPA: hypothetical protein VLS85_05415 [Hanamia sp.]|nr:hypothetical protein [Hanamia sp.]
MKKIVVVLDPVDNPWPVITFATHFAKNDGATVHLVFLTLPEEVDYNYPYPNDLSIAEDFTTMKNISESNAQLIEDKIQLFKQEFESSQIIFISEKNISVEDLIKKTEDADILIADEGTGFLKKVLPHIHCPAFIAGEDHLPEKVVLMFNNSDNSKYAIESYISLLPQFQKLPTFLLSINPDDEKENENYLNNLKFSFADISLKSLYGNMENQMEDFLSGLSGHILVIMGAFGRTEISRFFHKSRANSVMKEKNVSLFIAHK